MNLRREHICLLNLFMYKLILKRNIYFVVCVCVCVCVYAHKNERVSSPKNEN